MIICVNGLAGSGKTTFVEFLKTEFENRKLRYEHINSDLIAKKIYPDKYGISNPSDDYSSHELETIYNAMFLVFEKVLLNNSNTIILTDGTYRYFEQRLRTELVSEKCNVKFININLQTDVAISKSRLEKRAEKTGLGGWVKPENIEKLGDEIHFTVKNNGEISELVAESEKFIKKLFYSFSYSNKFLRSYDRN